MELVQEDLQGRARRLRELDRRHSTAPRALLEGGTSEDELEERAPSFGRSRVEAHAGPRHRARVQAQRPRQLTPERERRLTLRLGGEQLRDRAVDALPEPVLEHDCLVQVASVARRVDQRPSQDRLGVHQEVSRGQPSDDARSQPQGVALSQPLEDGAS